MTNTHGIKNDYYINRLLPTDTAMLKAQTESVAALAAEIWTEHYTPIIGAEQVEYMLAKFQSAEQIYADITQNEYSYYIAEDCASGKPIAYCGVVPEDNYLYLSKLYVQRDSRGKGIARSFIDVLIVLCKSEYNLGKIRLRVNKNNADSITAYEKLGFTITEEIKSDIGEQQGSTDSFYMDDYIMELSVWTLTRNNS